MLARSLTAFVASSFHSLSLIICYEIYPSKCNLRKKEFILAHNLRVQFFMTRKSQKQKFELVTLHPQPVLSQLFALQIVQDPSTGKAASHFNESSTSVNLTKLVPHRHIQSCVSQVILDLVKLVISTIAYHFYILTESNTQPNRRNYQLMRHSQSVSLSQHNMSNSTTADEPFCPCP